MEFEKLSGLEKLSDSQAKRLVVAVSASCRHENGAMICDIDPRENILQATQMALLHEGVPLGVINEAKDIILTHLLELYRELGNIGIEDFDNGSE